jgi:hypothetical protein
MLSNAFSQIDMELSNSNDPGLHERLANLIFPHNSLKNPSEQINRIHQYLLTLIELMSPPPHLRIFPGLFDTHKLEDAPQAGR